MKEINRRIRHYRKKAALTQGELAELIGMKSSTYSQAEREGNITCELLLKVAPFLNVAPEVLLVGEKPEEAPTPPPPPPPPPPPRTEIEYDFTQKEINIIKIYRHSSREDKNKIYELLNSIMKKGG